MSNDLWFQRFIENFVACQSRKAGAARRSSRQRRVASGWPTPTCRIEALENRQLLSAAFTAGDLVVLDLAAAAANTTGSIMELDSSSANQASPALTVSIDSTDGNALRFSSAGTMGRLSDSNDGHLLVIGGANTSNPIATTPDVTTVLTRGIGTFDNSLNYNLATTYTGISTNQVRAVTTVDDSTFYVADKGGLYTNNATSPSLATNILSAKSFGGTVYIGSAKSPAVAVSTVSGPTATSLTALPGMPVDANINDFYLISSGNNGSTYDVFYTVDSTAASNIKKYALISGTWTAEGSYSLTGAGNSIAAATDGSGGAYLYVSGGTGSAADNSIYRLDDTAAWNATINITTANNVTLYTATGTNVIKGIAFAPTASTAPNRVQPHKGGGWHQRRPPLAAP